MRKKRPLDRKAKPVRDASLVVIASEDRYAVRQYFDFFESTRIQFRVLETPDGKSAPEHVLNRISDYLKEFEIDDGDTFWVVCDCDHWTEPNHIQNLIRVLKECRQKRIQVALSNPCFDLWLRNCRVPRREYGDRAGDGPRLGGARAAYQQDEGLQPSDRRRESVGRAEAGTQ